MENGEREKNNNYPAIRYRFTGAELEIHLYLEFVQYNIRKEGSITYANRSNADNVTFDGENNYKSLCLTGLFKYYDNVNVNGNANDFQKGISFKTKLFVHERNTGRCFTSPTISTQDTGINKEQYYIPVCLGGECPQCHGYFSEEEHWYHHDMHSVKFKGNIIDDLNDDCRENQANCIYMPEYAITVAENGVGVAHYIEKAHYVFAHEAGHALGLGDAYTTEGIDRMTDNDETCKMIKVDGEEKRV